MKSLNFFTKGQKFIKIALVNLALLFVFLELGSLGWYYVKYKHFFYTREKPKDKFSVGINLEGVRLRESVIDRFHPYFGFIQKPGPDFRPGFKVNNYGFISPYDYPFTKTKPNQFIIGIFGGSVASGYGIFEVQNQILPKYLKQLPGLQDKEFIILSFATAGYKQPQQLLILNYFLALGQELDMVVNIDGFNEVALANLNNQNKINLAMPSIQHILSLTNIANNSLSIKAMKATIAITESKVRINRGLKRMQECKLAACDALTSIYVQNLVNNYRKDVVGFEKERNQPQKDEGGSAIYINLNNAVMKDEAAFDKMASMWYASSIAMNQILSSRKIAYFHFIQPNQYYPTKRVFTTKEQEIAISKDSPYIEGVTKGYPVLLSKVGDLQKAGVNIFSGVNILDDAKETVYKDACCHYNLVGDEILANYVSSSIVQTLRKSQQTIPPN